MFTELITETSQKRYESASALIFSFFLLLLTNFKRNLIAKGVEPLPFSLQHHFIGKMEEELAAQASWGWAPPLQSNIFFLFSFFLLVIYDTLNKRVERAIFVIK